SSFLKISSNFAFSVLMTLPLKGSIAWKRRSRPCLADPPAESPSTKNSSFFLEFLDWAGVNLPDKSVRSEEHTSELQSRFDLVCRLLLDKKNNRLHPDHPHPH